MTKYVCVHCGHRVEILEDLETGTALVCNECGRVTIVELFTPEERPWYGVMPPSSMCR